MLQWSLGPNYLLYGYMDPLGFRIISAVSFALPPSHISRVILRLPGCGHKRACVSKLLEMLLFLRVPYAVCIPRIICLTTLSMPLYEGSSWRCRRAREVGPFLWTVLKRSWTATCHCCVNSCTCRGFDLCLHFSYFQCKNIGLGIS